MEGYRSSDSSEASSIEGWSKDEKYYLFQALKKFSSHETDRIHEYISTKTPQQIELAINHFKKLAAQHPMFNKNSNKSKRYYKQSVPLTNWAKLLTDNIPLEDLNTETSKAVRMLADLEVFPEPAHAEEIDFRKVYHTIANAMEGKPLQADKVTVAVLNKCIVETALTSKAFIRNSSLKYLSSTIDFDKEAHSFPKPTEDKELGLLRYLAARKNYNPLRLSEEYLTPNYEHEPNKKNKGKKSTAKKCVDNEKPSCSKDSN